MLADKALLVYVNISQWTGRKLDRRATETVASTYSADASAGNYTKKLIPGCKELDRINRLQSRIRQYFYRETLPWFSDGARVIKGSSYMPFLQEFRKMRDEFDRAVNDFINVYPALQVHARFALGSLYSSEEYPAPERLARKFRCDIQVMPIPDVSDFRTEVSESEKRKFLETMESVHAEAMRDCWTRLHDVVSKAADKLSSPDARFKESLLDNITELCELLPRLNITDDPQLEAARVRVESTVSKLSPDVLRVNKSERKDAAAKLADITKAMGAFMGGDK